MPGLHGAAQAEPPGGKGERHILRGWSQIRTGAGGAAMMAGMLPGCVPTVPWRRIAQKAARSPLTGHGAAAHHSQNAGSNQTGRNTGHA